MNTQVSSPVLSDGELDPELADLIERLTDRIQAGEPIDLDSCVREHPRHAERLRALLPAMQVLADVGRSTGSRFAALVAPPDPIGAVVLGDYQVLRPVGRGGMGIVYEAVQQSLGRHVALKVLPVQSALDPTYLERFRLEAQTAARLHHTNIVPVYGVGEHQGVHFYAMQFIQGEGIDALLRRRRNAARGAQALPVPPVSDKSESGSTPAEPTQLALDASGNLPASLPAIGAGSTEANRHDRTDGDRDEGPELNAPVGKAYFHGVAQLGVQVAEALEYAHTHGVLHRDIKPSNLLLDKTGVVWVTDFGLAKVEGSVELTGSGAVVGTLRYMAPERFQGKSDPRSDVYSLAATLYELLTLRPIFEEENPLRLVEHIRHDNPPRPRQLERAIPRDLETIVLKGLDKSPEGRYTSAGAMADDLRRFLADQSIRARRLAWYEHLTRWCRRNPTLAVAEGLAVAAILAVAVISTIFAFTKRADAAALETKQGETIAALGREEERRKDVETKTLLLTKEIEERTRYARLSAGLALDRGQQLCESGKVREGLTWMARALEIYPGEAPQLEEAIRLNLTEWERECPPLRTRLQHDAPVTLVALSPDGKTIVTGADDVTFHLWDVATGRVIGRPLRFPEEQGASRMRVQFSPDSRRVLLAKNSSNLVRVVDTQTGALVCPPLRQQSNVYHTCFNEDGTKVLVVGAIGQARLWDTRTGKSIGGVMAMPGRNVMACAFSADGKLVRIACSLDRGVAKGTELRAWDATTGQPAGQPLTLATPGTSFLAFTPDRTKLLTGSSQDLTFRYWDVATGKLDGEPVTIPAPWGFSTQLSPDGKKLVVVHQDNIRVFEMPSGKVLVDPLPHGIASLLRTTFSAEGNYLVSSGKMATGETVARVWRLPECTALGQALTQEPNAAPPVCSPDGRTLFLSKGQFVDLTEIAPRSREECRVEAAGSYFGFAAGGRFVFTVVNRDLMLWDASTGKKQAGPLTHTGSIQEAWLSRDGHTVATREEKGQVTIWDLRAPDKPAHTISQDPPLSPIRFITLSDDGRILATRSEHQASLRFWDTRTGMPLCDTLPHPRPILRMAFRKDNESLVVVADDGVRVWAACTGKQIGKTLLHSQGHLLAVSGDGRYVLYGRRDSDAILHDTVKHTSVSIPATVRAMVAEFTPDARRFVIGCTVPNGSGHVFTLRTTEHLQPLGEPVIQHLAGFFTLNSDGRLLLTATHRDRSALVWHLETGKPAGPAVVHPTPIRSAVFDPAGSCLLIQGVARGNPTVDLRLLRTPMPIEGDKAKVVLRIEVLTGLEMDSEGRLLHLSAATWHERRSKLELLDGIAAH